MAVTLFLGLPAHARADLVAGRGRSIDAKGGISQLCCSDRSSTPCFPSRDDGTITRRGTPATDGGTAVFAATFCVPRPTSPLLAATTGLPGPTALLLPARVTVIP
jgi:hypothetical protein